MLHRAMQHHVLRIGTLLTQSNKGVSINDAHIYLKNNIDVDLDFNLQLIQIGSNLIQDVRLRNYFKVIYGCLLSIVLATAFYGHILSIRESSTCHG